MRWHDGQPFTSRDVKHTFDIVREAKEAPGKLRLSPQKDWYANVETIEAPEPHTVIFRLKRPQPLRFRCVGTGPFKLKEYVRGQLVEMVRNPDYFVATVPISTASATPSSRSEAPVSRRSMPGSSTSPCRSR